MTIGGARAPVKAAVTTVMVSDAAADLQHSEPTGTDVGDIPRRAAERLWQPVLDHVRLRRRRFAGPLTQPFLPQHRPIGWPGGERDGSSSH